MKNLYSVCLFTALLLLFNQKLIAQCTIYDASDCVCEDPSQTDCDLLPDIQLSWFGIVDVSDGPTEYSQDDNSENAGRLRISASTPNDGYGPLTVRGVDENGWSYFICGDDTIINQDPNGNLSSFYCDNGETARQITFQRIYHRNSDGSMSYYDRMAGSMTYHPTHGHNHSDDWGVFTLRTMDPNEPNPLNWPIVSDGAKMGFCLMDYGTCGDDPNSIYYGHCRDENRYSPDYLESFPQFNDGTNGGTIKTNADYPNFGLGGGGYGCSPIEQGISAGWLDLYGEWLDDQWINLEPGLCNGIYWIIGEVDRNNDYLESNEDNNWTAVQVELTQQLDGEGYNISIVVPDETTICDGEIITLSASSSSANTYLWSNGATTSSIEVSESGTYSLSTTSECGNAQSELVTVTVNDPIAPPVSESVVVTVGESATLEATGTGNILWYDESGNLLETGNTLVTDPLYESTSFFATNEEVLVEAPTELFTGAPTHECDGSSNCNYSGSVYNGGLRFNALSDFTLNSVQVFTDTDGERTIQLINGDDMVVNELTININETGDNGSTIILNWDITEGNDYILTTDESVNNTNFGDNNPILKRTTGGLPNFPYTIENIVNIIDGYYNNYDGNEGTNTDYYYYFYNWKINNDWNIGGTTCVSEGLSVEVTVAEMEVLGCTDIEACNYNLEANTNDGSCLYLDGICEACINGQIINFDTDEDGVCNENDCSPEIYNPDQDCSNIDDIYNSGLLIYPNPTINNLNINFLNNLSDVELSLFNNLGELIGNIYSGDILKGEIIEVDTRKLQPGNYFISCIHNRSSTKHLFTVIK